MEVRLLGPVEVTDGDRLVRIGARKQRALLTALALEAGRVLPPETLIDCLWEKPPASAAHAIQVYVSALRRALSDGDVLRLRPSGYVLEVAPEDVDALRFERLASEGRHALADGEPARAAALLRVALGLWRGAAFADAVEGDLGLEAARLEERRLESQEALLEAQLRLGDIETVLAEAERLRATSPLREQTVRLVMLARYHAGQQVEALETFRTFRTQLDDELGLVPSQELRELETAILRQDVPEPAPRRAGGSSAPRAPHLIGRERELRDIASLLAGAPGQIVTLTGPGGIGKTSIALAIADELDAAYAGGAVVVRLAELDDPALVLPTIATQVEAAPSDEDPTAGIAARLAAAPALVVLDNAEHLSAAAPGIAQLAEQSRRSAFLVTSRTPLRVARERVVRLPPLAVPEAEASAAQCLSTPSVALLLERAREHGVEVHEREAETLGSIARRLGGVPLAIELAAARIGVLGAAGLLSRLDHALDILATDRQDAPDRQRTLRAVIEWSERLLEERERELLATLSVFAGGASLAAIAHVSGAAEAELLDALSSLVDHGLVRREMRGGIDSEPRFVLPEPIHAYAAERLLTSGRDADVRERHAEWTAAFAHETAAGLLGRGQESCLLVLDSELANIRAAVHWAKQDRPQVAVELVVDLYQYWFARGLLREARDLLEIPLGMRGELEPEVWARAAARAAWFDTELGRLEDAAQLAEDAAEVFRERADNAWLQRALGALATASSARGQWEEAARLNREILGLARSGGDERDLAYALMNTASDAELAGDSAAVGEMLEEALGLLVRVEDERGVALAEVNLAACRLMEGDEAGAAALAERSLERVRRLDLRVVLPYVLAVTAHTLVANEPLRAVSLARDAARLAVEQGLYEALCTAGLARASAHASVDQPEAALEAFSAVEAFARSSGLALPLWFRERAERVVRGCVEPERWEIARDASRSLTRADAESVLCS